MTRDIDQSSLVSRSLKALKWSYAGLLARIGLQLIAQIVIARLIGPSAFGSASAAIFVMAVTYLVAELGLGPALIQQKSDPTAHDLRLVLRRIVIATSFAALITIVCSEYVALFWGDPDVGPLIECLIVALVAQAAGLISLALLRRQLDFKWIQIAQVSGYFVGFVVVGIAVASAGGGAWSLVSAWIAQNIFTTVLLYWRTRHPIDFWRSASDANQGIVGYGYRILLTNIANWTIENIDNLMIGRAFGTHALGTYTVSYNLVRTPTNHLVTSIQQVLFPASAQAHSSTDGHALAYLIVVWVVSLIAFPVFLSVAVLAPTVVDALYGAKWESAATILLPLAIAMPFHAVMAVGGPILWGRGQAIRELKVQAVLAIAMVALLILLANFSMTAMVWGVVAVYFCRAVWIQSQVASTLGIEHKSLFRALHPGLVVGFVSATVIFLGNNLWQEVGLSSLPRLGVAVATGALLAAGVLALARKLLPPEIRQGLYLRHNLPPLIQQVLGIK